MQAPPADVLAAFALVGQPVVLPGGQGNTWRVGQFAVKPCGLPADAAWVAETVTATSWGPPIRVPRPVSTADGRWTASGWEAWELVPGEPDEKRWDDVIVAGEAFHQALSGMARPSFLDMRDNPWAYGERVAWAELPVNADGVMADMLMALAQARRPVRLPAQPVHGDLLGNVLFADNLPPAIIDWPVYFRPPAWSLAVVVIDALTWHGAPADLLSRGEAYEEWNQMLIRALMFRAATNEGFRRAGWRVRESTADYQLVTDLVLAA